MSLFGNWKFVRFMDTEMLAPRSGETVELIAISVLVAQYCVLSLVGAALWASLVFAGTKRANWKNPIDGSTCS